ncbi:uncharacterized protein LOC135951869 [Calliphora vicina]|uniref:uncharacterized protein LOC135951869 n=1 Tax=Calliphora vicina TaxID=7373 RepID=UPI00325AEB20
MYKLVALLSLIVVVASGQVQQQNNSNNIDGFIDQNRQQYAQNIRDYDKQMETLKKTYTASLQVIPKRLVMLVDSIGQTEKRLNTLEVLSDSSKNCINKYRSKLPNVILTKQTINMCLVTASSQTDGLVIEAFQTRTSLDSYYKYNFEGNLQSCKVQPGDYNTCVLNAISSANAYTVSNRKVFDAQMKTAQVNANRNIQTALQCNYSTQNQTTSSLAEANTLINRCLQSQDECKPCNQGFSCPNITYLKRYEVDYNNPLMKNVFYERYDLTKCLLLKIVN